MGVPPYYTYGKKYWLSVKKELQMAICSSSKTYAQDKKDLGQAGKQAITVGVPILMASYACPRQWLDLPY